MNTSAFASSNRVCNSISEPRAIFKKRRYSVRLCHPCPSAMFDGIDTTERRIGAVRPKRSVSGIRVVT